ncbi:PP-loop family-domain-containing protein [Trametes punicea]|nr:PP-loop family-domain-containing protein [Trametes punicea]
MPGLIPPITPGEFFQYLQKCMPPTGWSRSIAVANSGGPDSAALLFLLHATIQERLAMKLPLPLKKGTGEPQLGIPHQVLSVHVNHGMQTAASDMETVAARTAESLGIKHKVEKIPWEQHPFPARDAVDEKVAREARYNRLFKAMRNLDTDVIAFGHHADDQVETAIMRMSQGSSTRGLAAMRPVRRWGMGKKDNEYFAFGAEGMRKWLVRPFLHVSKDRLLATCDANKLEYVNDPTNFQPGLTFRNRVRRILSEKEQASCPESASSQSSQADSDIEPYISRLRAEVPEGPLADQMREAVRLYGIRLEEIDGQVTNILARSRLPSPPSTLLLKSQELAEATDEEVRFALIRRCLRYTSHGPWGAVWSEASGGRETLRRVAEELWPSTPRTPLSEMPIDPVTNAPIDPRKTFAAAAGVIVYPVTIKQRKNQIRYRGRRLEDDDEVEGWLLARTPPYEKSPPYPDATAVVDATDGILAARAAGKKSYKVLYDYRFEIVFDVGRKLPEVVDSELFKRGARIVIEPNTKWVLPKVMLQSRRTSSSRCIGKYIWNLIGWKDRQKRPEKYQSWIDMKFVRSLDAI